MYLSRTSDGKRGTVSDASIPRWRFCVFRATLLLWEKTHWGEGNQLGGGGCVNARARLRAPRLIGTRAERRNDETVRIADSEEAKAC